MNLRKWIDTLFAWVLIMLGAAHILSRWVPALIVLRGPWVGAGAVAIVTMGLMNAVRSQRKGDRWLRWSTAMATVLTGALCFSVLYHTGNVLHEQAALTACILAVAEVFFALAG